MVSWKSNIYTETYAFQTLPSSHLFWPRDNEVSVFRSVFGRNGPWRLFCDQTECESKPAGALGALITLGHVAASAAASGRAHASEEHHFC